MSFIDNLRQGAEAAKNETFKKKSARPLPDRWPTIIERIHGRRSASGVDWIAARDVFEELGIPAPARPSFSRCVAGLMKNAGWVPNLVGPRHARMRGYVRSSKTKSI